VIPLHLYILLSSPPSFIIPLQISHFNSQPLFSFFYPHLYSNQNMSNISMVEAKLPPGFRFHPRDEELVCDYLMKKVTHNDSLLMIDVDLNKCEPWDIPGQSLLFLCISCILSYKVLIMYMPCFL